MCSDLQRASEVQAPAAAGTIKTLQTALPSGTAYRVALRRAAHQTADRPLVFADPLALRILGLDANGRGKPGSGNDLRAPDRPSSKSLRAFLVARSRFAEELLHTLVGAGVRQYVVLGAGLDTFAYRNPYPQLTVFEVDHPATQQWKQQLLRQAGIEVPSNTVHVRADFHQDCVSKCLHRAGFDPAKRAVFAWLGVVPYLHPAAVEATLQDLAGSAAHSLLLMDYRLPREALAAEEQLEFDSLEARVAAAGEPFQTWLQPEEARNLLAKYGWQVRQDLGRDTMNDRYFAGRTDSLMVSRSGARMLMAELIPCE